MIEQAIKKVFDILDDKQRLSKDDKNFIKALIRDLYRKTKRGNEKNEKIYN